MNSNYDKLYCRRHIYFMLKSLKLSYIKSDKVMTFDGDIYQITDSFNISDRDTAYVYTVSEIFKYLIDRYNMKVIINQNDNKWEWIVLNANTEEPMIYSGETEHANIRYNMGKNFPENRKYFDTELDAIEDAIAEIIIFL